MEQKVVEHGLKIDLHIHSYISSPKDGKKVAKNTLENLPILIGKLNENSVNICAITDHDAFSNELYTALKAEEKSSSSIKKVLPGVEFSVRFMGRHGEETLHVIAIFDDSDASKVQYIETVLKSKRPDSCGSYSEETFLAILREISVDTILIAHQKNTLSSTTTRKNDANSLGEDKFLELVFSDYFEAYEFKNRRNEIINKTISLKAVLRKILDLLLARTVTTGQFILAKILVTPLLNFLTHMPNVCQHLRDWIWLLLIICG